MPRSATQLRAFNWSKMPEGRVGGTIFDALDESTLYKFMDLEDIDRTFDATAGRKAGGEVGFNFQRQWVLYPLYKWKDNDMTSWYPIEWNESISLTPPSLFQGEKTLERIKSQRMHQISFLENRRQQNCTILLSKLKMTNEELIKWGFREWNRHVESLEQTATQFFL